jgi:hypothetical protein
MERPRANTLMKLIRVLALAAAASLFAAPAQADFERAELEQMLAPVALYPDSVLSHVLIAATYPDEVEEAARWSRRHPDLLGEDAVAAVEDRDWDPSVKALVAFPELLARMGEDPDWTARLGDAFIDQEGEVMDAVQTLREHAYESGHLRTTEHVRVIREREYIYLEPAVHHVVYVPYYDPWVVYGSWWWPHHPPYHWRTWYGHSHTYYRTGFYWGVGFRIAPTFYFSSFYWPERRVVVVHHRSPNWRPLYSGRDVPRHAETRHWRAERPHVRAGSSQRPESRRSQSDHDRREDRGPRGDRREHGGRQEDDRRTGPRPPRGDRGESTRLDGSDRQPVDRGESARDDASDGRPRRERPARESRPERDRPEARPERERHEARPQREHRDSRPERDPQAAHGRAQREQRAEAREAERRDSAPPADHGRGPGRAGREESREDSGPRQEGRGKEGAARKERGRSEQREERGRGERGRRDG